MPIHILLAYILAALRGTADLVNLVKGNGSSAEIVAGAVTSLSTILAAAQSIRDLVVQLADSGVDVPSLAELDALMDEIKTLPPLTEHKAPDEV